jgi:hypothetical protein
MRADGADADEQFPGDLGIGVPLCDKRDQFAFPRVKQWHRVGRLAILGLSGGLQHRELSGGVQGHGGPALARDECLLRAEFLLSCLRRSFPALGILRRVGQPASLLTGCERRPQGYGCIPLLAHGAQVTAEVETVADHQLMTCPQGEVESFTELRGRLLRPVCTQIDIRQVRQAFRLIKEIACVPGSSQRLRAYFPGLSVVTGLGQGDGKAEIA